MIVTSAPGTSPFEESYTKPLKLPLVEPRSWARAGNANNSNRAVRKANASERFFIKIELLFPTPRKEVASLIAGKIWTKTVRPPRPKDRRIFSQTQHKISQSSVKLRYQQVIGNGGFRRLESAS
jgi:hypothetical protein